MPVGASLVSGLSLALGVDVSFVIFLSNLGGQSKSNFLTKIWGVSLGKKQKQKHFHLLGVPVADKSLDKQTCRVAEAPRRLTRLANTY